ncbi:MAG: hypothetical protein COZ85_00935 [Candidatus Moranbacteria bacterium CG_4_8_14_3_um_filter_34_16]|nr:MAG: hypothetical protein COT31_00955 [Candidatus Moranbacteria bacterium CG08_land_8_20_14_0_20_34_16]PIW95243.1 MAG: hypothetical protein COZ85_00935 [Candidatus Moranbacteria bacterium CG_4_8_14_3_um_filter_34_16]PJA89134.1 MAG: hypothetical protein CO138_02105 [Candidatus Moranbacteria bacterium CG_4_9_14_3_um_filter_33_15]
MTRKFTRWTFFQKNCQTFLSLRQLLLFSSHFILQNFKLYLKTKKPLFKAGFLIKQKPKNHPLFFLLFF